MRSRTRKRASLSRERSRKCPKRCNVYLSQPTLQILGDISRVYGKAVSSITIDSYKTQVVAGLNYRLKATTDAGESVIVLAFKPLPHTGNPIEIKSVDAGAEL